ncbi:HEAT repeat domain-containing protein [Salinirubrum litoreum]|uniref:HEAT repeat domain-containing protein n=1 Tax=Salinirubrum litoreum TaxID=1126234 RepID=A0ABD5RGT0_9EURY|nr:HEAT repeat domain-containing protein [Salinirubrum litoreum]
MRDSDQPPPPDHLPDLLQEGTHEETVACLDRLGAADGETRKRALQAVREFAAERPSSVADLVGPLSTFLTDEDRAVRLTTAKLFVALAQSEPTVVLSGVDVLADRLADEEEFYYVRARCAEALGYVAVEAPEAVADPETLADLRIGLAFDEPEVKEKLAKALAHVALGDPSRLRHHVSSLAEHLDDDDELVRYHLCTALVVVGCEYPGTLAETTGPLQARLADENPYVQGRAAEALGLLAGSDTGVEGGPAFGDGAGEREEPPTFLTDRLAFCRRQGAAEQSGEDPDGVGTRESIREATEEVVEEMTTPDGSACPHCGFDLPESGPPMCPGCGAPR